MQIDELKAAVLSKPFKPDISLLFDKKEEPLFEVWKAEESFGVVQVEKDEKEETQLEHYEKIINGYYEAWRGHDERRREGYHHITCTMK